MCGVHDDIGHLGLERMLDILCNRFYWLNLEADVTHHVCICEWCLRFKSKQGKAELLPLLATYPLELVHMGFLTIENPYTGADVNILVITDHFTWYAKAVVTPNHLVKVMEKAFWDEFIVSYGFPEKLLTGQGLWVSASQRTVQIGQDFEWHLIIQKLMPNVKDSNKLLSAWLVCWTPKTCTTGKIIYLC